MKTTQKVTTLDTFIIEKQKDFPFATGELTGLCRDLGFAAKILHRAINKAGLIDILGETGTVNIQGEVVKKLDEYANEILLECLQNSGECCGVASEEMDSFVAFDSKESKHSQYVVMFDPLDGSSNIEVGAPIGTIFSIYRRISQQGTPCTLEDFLQKGNRQVAAGYLLYGSSTMLIYTTGNGVNGFTLDTSLGEFCLSHKDIQLPQLGKVYSINQGNYNSMPVSTQKYIDWCMTLEPADNRPFSLRYIGSLIGDFHRNLLQGGIYIYPSTMQAPKGKLRLLYEGNPMSFICEQAGGKGLDEKQNRILDIKPTELHQRTTLYIGSEHMINKCFEFFE